MQYGQGVTFERRGLMWCARMGSLRGFGTTPETARKNAMIHVPRFTEAPCEDCGGHGHTEHVIDEWSGRTETHSARSEIVHCRRCDGEGIVRIDLHNPDVRFADVICACAACAAESDEESRGAA